MTAIWYLWSYLTQPFWRTSFFWVVEISIDSYENTLRHHLPRKQFCWCIYQRCGHCLPRTCKCFHLLRLIYRSLHSCDEKWLRRHVPSAWKFQQQPPGLLEKSNASSNRLTFRDEKSGFVAAAPALLCIFFFMPLFILMFMLFLEKRAKLNQ